MQSQQSVTLRVLFYQEGAQWIAQCVDFDINAHGESIGLAQRAFEHAVIAEIVTRVENNQHPFEKSNTVPTFFAQAFEDALAEKLEQRNIKVPPNVPPAFMIGAIAAERRVSGTI